MARGIAAIGECMLELSGQSGNFWRMGHAGDTFNTLWMMRALTDTERPADYVSAFGDDPFSADQIAFFQKHDIGIAASPIIAGARPGLYAITLSDGERSFTYWRADSAARQLTRDPAALAKSLENRKLIYFSGITLAILEPAARGVLLDAVTAARLTGTRIAFDPNYRPSLWPDTETARAAIRQALATVDIALPTFGDESTLFGDSTPEQTTARIEQAGVGEIVVKNGDAPALIAHYGDRHDSPATHAAVVVDTTGAGDGFNGAYLAARLAGDAPVDAAHRAHSVAAAVIQVRGALAPFELLRVAFKA
jgi:2-dehydro-3-deoxygluconokinase